MSTDPKSTVDRPHVRLDRRSFALGVIALLAAPGIASARGTDNKFVLEARFMPQVVVSPYDRPAGTTSNL